MTEKGLNGQVKTPLGKLTFGIMFGYTFMMVGFLTPAVLLLSLKMVDIDPHGYTTSYGLVAGVGAFFALIGNPLGGAVSDRTNIQFGRRRTWIFLGSLLGCFALVWIAFATQIWQVIVAWSMAQLFFNFGMAAYTALIPDQVEEAKRGTVSGLLGLTMPIGIVIGLVAMMALKTAPEHIKWLIVVAASIVGPIVSLLFINEGKVVIEKEEKTKTSFGEKISRVYPSPRKFPEFSWAIFSKFLLMMGFCSTTYLTLMLINRLGFSKEEATTSVGTMNMLILAAAGVTSIIGGLLSDKLRKQKPFLYISAFMILAALLIFSFVPSHNALLLACIIMGLGLGCFTSVDMALVARILPNKEDSAKDFGLMNVANALPQSIVPAIAPVLLAVGGGHSNWTLFYLFLSICTVVGIVALKPLPEVGKYKGENAEILREAK